MCEIDPRVLESRTNVFVAIVFEACTNVFEVCTSVYFVLSHVEKKAEVLCILFHVI